MGIWNLETLWFVLIGVLWVGYFFLEGFDFGVGTLLRILGKDETDRRALINTIGPERKTWVEMFERTALRQRGRRTRRQCQQPDYGPSHWKSRRTLYARRYVMAERVAG